MIGGILRQVAEDLHPVLLTVDEAVALFGVEAVAAADLAAFFFDCIDQQCFHGQLCFLAFLIGGGTEIAVGDEDDVLGAHVVRFLLKIFDC